MFFVVLLPNGTIVEKAGETAIHFWTFPVELLRFMIAHEIVAQYFPIAVKWVTEMEKVILDSGQRLMPENRKDAILIGIQRVDDVRILVSDNIPLPMDRGLRQLALQRGLITDRTSGMTFGHGIVLKNGAVNRGLLAHELVHVMQYERFGGIEAFLKEYVKEVAFDPGYRTDPWNGRRSAWLKGPSRTHRNNDAVIVYWSRKSDPGPVQPRSWRDFRTRTRIALTSSMRQRQFPRCSKVAREKFTESSTMGAAGRRIGL
jgi:hypothetical protein